MDNKAQKKAPKMNVYKPSAKMIAAAAGVKESTVYSFEVGRRVNGKAAKRIAKAKPLLEQGQNALIEAVRQAVNF